MFKGFSYRFPAAAEPAQSGDDTCINGMTFDPGVTIRDRHKVSPGNAFRKTDRPAVAGWFLLLTAVFKVTITAEVAFLKP